MKKIIIGLSVILFGCKSSVVVLPEENEPKLVEEVFNGFVSPSDDIRYFRASVSFSDEEREKIVEYLNLLSQKTGQYIGIVFNRPEKDTDCPGLFTPGERKEIFITCGSGGTWQGNSRVIRVGWIADPYVSALFVAHEVGHDLGMGHVKRTEDGSLMQPVIYPTDHFTWSEYDQEECVRVGLCK